MTITHFKIFPSLGIARVGNSPDAYFFGPELPGPHPKDDNDFRDAQGRIKRQAARFRIYGFDADGNAVQEITSADAQINWTVEVANRKSQWFDFHEAMDIPSAMGTNGAAGLACNRRNAGYSDRDALAITPPPVRISGDKQEGAPYQFNGTYMKNTDVYLGECRTDHDGRLIFLGGLGKSTNPEGKPATTFANNEGWHDDVSDGPVNATITYKGQTFEADGAWVLTGPPNYAPGIQGIITGYDLLFEVACTLDPSLAPEQPSFSEHIWPLLRRFPQNQWVNGGFARDYGFGGGNDWDRPEFIARLNDKSDASATLRNSIRSYFRPADYSVPVSNALPQYYGDAMSTDTTSTDPREWMAVLEIQGKWLDQWADGDFIDDGPGEPPGPWNTLTPQQQVDLIDRGVLDETLGGPFHPGAEFTWPMRHASIYRAPFRIKQQEREPDFGSQLDSEKALAPNGPLNGSIPGGLTRWMAVPWQTDTSSCLSAYVPYVDDYLPTFWPARVPNDVLAWDDYQLIMDTHESAVTRAEAFVYTRRVKWLWGIRYVKPVSFPPEMIPSIVGVNRFIKDWPEVGIIVEKPGPTDDDNFPDTMWVETGRSLGKTKTRGAVASTDYDGPTIMPWDENPRKIRCKK